MIRGRGLRQRLLHRIGHSWPTVQRFLPRRPLPYPTRVGLMWLDLGDSTESLRRVLRVYEPMKFANLERFLPRGGTFVDVGANLGDFSIWAAQCGGAGTRVLAVEADPDNAVLLRRNIRRHRLDSTVTVVAQAAAAEEGSVTLLQGKTAGQSTIVESELHGLDHLRPRGSVEVQARRLDDIIATASIDQVDVMKIDVEGAEEFVLTGAPALLDSGKPLTLLIDLHWGVNRAWIASRLQSAGFTIRTEDQPDVVIDTVADSLLSIVCIRT